MTGLAPDLPDLAALREKAEDRAADPYERIARYEELDEALTAHVEKLWEYAYHWPICGAPSGGLCRCGWDKVRAALSVSPAEKGEA